MPDENIQIVIQDQVAGTIDTKLQAIETSALGAMDALTRMQQAISKVDASAINRASQQVGQQGAQFRAATTNINAYTTALTRADGRLDSLTAKIVANTTAINAQAAALAVYATAASAATAASSTLSAAQQQVTSSTAGASGGFRQMSAAAGLATGSVNGAARTFLIAAGAGKLLAAIFPLLGVAAGAFIAIDLVSHLADLVKAFQNLSGAETDAALHAVDLGNKIANIKPNKFTLDALARFAIGAPQNQPVQFSNPAETSSDARQGIQLQQAQNRVNESGLKGSALDQQKIKDQQTLNTLYQNAAKEQDAIAQSIKDQLQATTQVVTDTGNANYGISQTVANVRKITDPTQVKAMTAAYKEATDAAKQFRTESQISQLNSQADQNKVPGASQKEAQAAFITNAQENLALQKSQEQLSLYQERAYWQSMADAAKSNAYPQAYREAIIQVGNLSQEIDRKQTEAVQKARKQLAEQNESSQRVLDSQADIAEKMSNDVNALSKNWDAYYNAIHQANDIQAQNTTNLQLANIQVGEQNGYISKATAAWASYQAQLKLVNTEILDNNLAMDRVANDKALSPSEQATQMQQLQNRGQQLTGQRSVLQAQNANTVNPQQTSPLGQVFGQGQGGFAQQIQSAFQPVQELQQTFNTAFKGIEDGAAQSIGHAIVYAKNLGDALKDVARQGLESIISGLIKVGLQWVAMQAIQALLGQTAVASTAAAATSAALAWAPAAVAASIATFGAADAVGSAAYASSLTTGQLLTTGLASAGNLATGGFVFGRGTGVSDNLTALLSPGEYVMPANSTAQYLPELNAMRSGNYSGQTSSGQSPLNVTVHTDQQTGVQVQPVSRDEVQIIATQVANQVVTTQAPRAVANDISNGNGHVTQAITRNMFIQRRTN